MNVTPTRRWFQFGMGTLLFITFCVAGYFGGYRRGFDHGQEAKNRVQCAAKAYYIRDIIAASSGTNTADALSDYIQAAIIPGSWQANGGPGSISYSDTHTTIVVYNIQDVHDQLADALVQIRRLQQQGQAKEVDSILAAAVK
jgi:hypothetical protein